MNVRLTVEASPAELIRAINHWIATAAAIDLLDAGYLMVAAKAAEAKSQVSDPVMRIEPEGRRLADSPGVDQLGEILASWERSQALKFSLSHAVAERQTPPESAGPSAPHDRGQERGELLDGAFRLAVALELANQELDQAAQMDRLEEAGLADGPLPLDGNPDGSDMEDL